MLTHKRHGRTVVVIHHSGKNGEQRGTSKHEDALDFCISLKPSKSDIRDGSLSFGLEWKKARHLASDEIAPFTVTMAEDKKGQMSWIRSEGIALDPRLKTAIDMNAAGKTMQQIANALDCDKSTVSRMLKRK
jgi:putative DNA primase/helicase